jgi:hypothetical protein
MPRCLSVLVNGEHVLAEICHIRARRKGGPRYDPALSAADRDGFANLILFCPTCHTLADKDRKTYTVDFLTRAKAFHEGQAVVELTTPVIDQALRIFAKISENNSAKAVAKGRGIAVAIGGDNHAPINIKTSTDRGVRAYPANSIGADANLTNYIEYLCGLYVDYAASMYPDENDRWIRIGTAIKRKFRLKKRTRGHLSAERFNDLVLFLREKLAETPPGKKHRRDGTKMCRTFEEFRHGAM